MLLNKKHFFLTKGAIILEQTREGKRWGCYLRVSTDQQSVDSQLTVIKEYLARNKIENFEFFIDEGISGAVENRPSLNRLMKLVEEGKIDSILTFAFSRIARSTSHLLKILQKCKDCKTGLVSITESIDTNSPLGVALYTILGALAQMEREMIVVRVRAGMRAAKIRGVRIGRERKRNDILIHSLLDAQLSYREIAKIAKCSHGSVSASRKEWLAKKSEEEKKKIAELSNSITKNKSATTIEDMKAMNIAPEIVAKVQSKIEGDARENVRSIQGEAYETYD